MKNVSKKLLAAITKVGGTVQKTGYNKFSSYAYITESDVNEAVLPALIEQGLLLTTSVESSQEFPSDGTSKNRFATVQLLHRIIDTESGEILEVRSTGTGADTLDKSIFKAITGSYKYMLLKLFMISGDNSDPENDGTVKDTPAKSFNKPTNFAPPEKKGFMAKKTETPPPAKSSGFKPSFGTKKPADPEESEQDAAF